MQLQKEILGLSIAYALLAVLLLVIALRARIPWPFKAAAVIVTSVYYCVAFFRIEGLSGWSTPTPLPSQFQLLWARVVEPDPFDRDPGAVHVWIEQLDAANLPAVWAARRFYHLPYFHAAMTSNELAGNIHYRSRRFQGAADFCGHYRPSGEIRLREKGSVEQWFTERYCLYTTHRSALYRGEIHHQPWPLQDAEAEFETNTVAAAASIALPGSGPLLHFARKLEVLIWPLRRAE